MELPIDLPGVAWAWPVAPFGSFMGSRGVHTWHDMFIEQIPLAEKIIRTIVVYALLMVLFRLTGKRGLAAMNTFDFIVVFLLSNLVQNAVIGDHNSVLGGMVDTVTLVAVNAGVNRLTAISPTAERLFEGRATKVIDGAPSVVTILDGTRRPSSAARIHRRMFVQTSPGSAGAGWRRGNRVCPNYRVVCGRPLRTLRSRWFRGERPGPILSDSVHIDDVEGALNGV
jgi:hypothetical protein